LSCGDGRSGAGGGPRVTRITNRVGFVFLPCGHGAPVRSASRRNSRRRESRRDGDRPWRHLIVIGFRLPGTPRRSRKDELGVLRTSRTAILLAVCEPCLRTLISSAPRDLRNEARTRNNNKERQKEREREREREEGGLYSTLGGEPRDKSASAFGES